VLNRLDRYSGGKTFPFAAIACAIATVSIVGVGLSLTITLNRGAPWRTGLFRARDRPSIRRRREFRRCSAPASFPASPGAWGVRPLLVRRAAPLRRQPRRHGGDRRFTWAWLGLRAFFRRGPHRPFGFERILDQRRRRRIGAAPSWILRRQRRASASPAGPLILTTLGTRGPGGFLVPSRFSRRQASHHSGQRRGAPAQDRLLRLRARFMLIAPVATLAGTAAWRD